MVGHGRGGGASSVRGRCWRWRSAVVLLLVQSLWQDLVVAFVVPLRLGRRAIGAGGGLLSMQQEGKETVTYVQDVLNSNKHAARSPKHRVGEWRMGLLGALLGSNERDPAHDRDRFFSDRGFMDEVLDSCVRIYCTHNLPSYGMPWQRLRQEASTSSGFVIEGRRIITNAHSVEYSSLIQVRKRGSDRKYLARPVAIGEECDLAILSVDDEEFWEDCGAIAFGSVPELTDDVTVIGYPVGGECISITAGVVSRVEMTVYAQAGAELLSIQIDAAINPGNSGGPAVNDAGEIVGVAFQSLNGDDVENIGYVVPINVLEHFLEDVERHGKFVGFPRLGTQLQFLESPTLRASLGMDEAKRHTGVLVTDIEKISPARAVLKKGDVIMRVDGIRVANDGSIPFRMGERVALRYYFSQRFPGDNVTISILRDGQEMDVVAPLSMAHQLCPVHFEGTLPSYLIIGGLVFTVLSELYLNEMQAQEGIRGSPYLQGLVAYGRKETESQQIVLLTQILAHSCNLGYEDMENSHLKKFNGVEVESLQHLADLYDKAQEKFLNFEFFPQRIICLDRLEVENSTAEICAENSIPTPRYFTPPSATK